MTLPCMEPLLRISVVTLFPELIQAHAASSIVGRAQQRGLVRVSAQTPRDFVGGRHRTVDDRPYGGGPGMVLAAPPMAACLDAVLAAQGPSRMLLTSPQGRRLDQEWLRELAAEPSLVLVCGHYEGIDERIVQLYQPELFSVGDYVLSGGELPALTLIDGVTRLVPGVLGHELSAQDDSFTGKELDHACWTKPREFRGLEVPEVLLSGDHARIDAWRAAQRRERTRRLRPDLENTDG